MFLNEIFPNQNS